MVCLIHMSHAYLSVCSLGLDPPMERETFPWRYGIGHRENCRLADLYALNSHLLLYARTSSRAVMRHDLC